MSESQITSRYLKHNKERVSQGDVLKDIKFSIGPYNDTASEVAFEDYEFPYCIVISQDCDLDVDFKNRNNTSSNQDKFLPSILVCPAYVDQGFFNGSHIKNQLMRSFTTKEVEKAKNNDEYNRIHYLDGDSSYQIPNLVIDFKHFYTLSREIVYTQYPASYLATISELFRERLSQRFSNYLSRIGLPEL